MVEVWGISVTLALSVCLSAGLLPYQASTSCLVYFHIVLGNLDWPPWLQQSICTRGFSTLQLPFVITSLLFPLLSFCTPPPLSYFIPQLLSWRTKLLVGGASREDWRGPVVRVAEHGEKDSFCMNGPPPARVSAGTPDFVPTWWWKGVFVHVKQYITALFWHTETIYSKKVLANLVANKNTACLSLKHHLNLFGDNGAAWMDWSCMSQFNQTFDW